jgi:hypothetical protein
MVEISLDDKGVNIGNITIPYKQMSGFWITTTDDAGSSINIETLGFLNRLITVELERQDPEEIRQFLAQFVPEHTAIKPTIAQRVTHWIRF